MVWDWIRDWESMFYYPLRTVCVRDSQQWYQSHFLNLTDQV